MQSEVHCISEIKNNYYFLFAFTFSLAFLKLIERQPVNNKTVRTCSESTNVLTNFVL